MESEFTLQADPNTDTSTPKDEIDSTSAGSSPTETQKQNCLRMYWLDAYEDPVHSPEVVFIFGKTLAPATTSDTTTTTTSTTASVASAPSTSTSGYQSCCVVVKNMERRVFFVPRATRRGTARHAGDHCGRVRGGRVQCGAAVQGPALQVADGCIE